LKIESGKLKIIFNSQSELKFDHVEKSI